MSTEVESAGSSVTARVWRAVLSLAAVAGLLYWALWFTALFILRCDENCGGDAYDSWRYPAQFVLGAIGFGLGVLAVPLGFTPLRTWYRACLVGSTACVLTWIVWVLFLGTF